MGAAWSARRVGVVVVALVAVVFAGSLDNGFVNWDDGIWIYDNPLVLDPGVQTWRDRLLTPQVGYPAPWVIAVYGWLWRLGGGAAWPFHGVSLVVHLVNVALLMMVLRWSGSSVRVMGFAGLAFGVHPVVVEPVAWATGLKDLVMATGFLVALVAMRRRPPWALAGAVLAFGSKPASVLLALPLAVSVREAARPRRSAWAIVAVIAAAGIALAILTMAQETSALRTRADVPFSLERVIGAAGLQIQHLVAPGTLAPAYAPARVGALQLGVGALTWAAIAWLAVRWIRGGDARLVWVALGVAAYLPVSNVVPLLRFTADSYMYVPTMAIVGGVASSAPTIGEALRRHGDRVVALVRALVVMVCVAWGVWSAVQVEVWADSVTLWRETYIAQPDDPQTIYRYGDALGRNGKLADEVALYLAHEQQLQRAEKIPVVLPVFYARKGDVDRAVSWYTRAFESPVAQDEAMYNHYVRLVARHPQAHPPTLDDALAYALPRYLKTHGVAELSPEQLANLAGLAARLRLPQGVQRKLRPR